MQQMLVVLKLWPSPLSTCPRIFSPTATTVCLALILYFPCSPVFTDPCAIIPQFIHSSFPLFPEDRVGLESTLARVPTPSPNTCPVFPATEQNPKQCLFTDW